MPLYPPPSSSGGGSPSNPGPDANHDLFYNFDMPVNSTTVTNLGATGATNDMSVVTTGGIPVFQSGDGTPNDGKNLLLIPGDPSGGQGAMGAVAYRPTTFSFECAFINLSAPVGTFGGTVTPPVGSFFGKYYNPAAYAPQYFSAIGWQSNDVEFGQDAMYCAVNGSLQKVYGNTSPINDYRCGSLPTRVISYVAATFDGRAQVYTTIINGQVMQSKNMTAGIDYNGNADGPWYVGSPFSGLASNGMLAIRYAVSPIVRPVSYFAGIWKKLNGWS